MAAGFGLKNALFLLVGLALWVLSGCGLADAEDWYQVRWVNDGDTVVLEDKQRVRYLGIDTPEMDYKTKKHQPFAEAARRLNRKLVTSGRIRMEFEKERQDRYERLLAYVFLEDGTFVNEALIAAGFAWFLPSRQDRKYDRQMLEAQRKAMQAGKGMWAKMIRTPQPLVGNRSSGRFHLKSCPESRRIAKHNRVRLKSKWDAFWAGYAPARGCIK